MSFIKGFLPDNASTSFLFFLFWPISYLAALSVKYSLVTLEFSQMPSYLKWLGEYSDHLSVSPSELLVRQTCTHYLRQKMKTVSVAMVTARVGGGCLQVIFVFRLHTCAHDVRLHMYAHICLWM